MARLQLSRTLQALRKDRARSRPGPRHPPISGFQFPFAVKVRITTLEPQLPWGLAQYQSVDHVVTIGVAMRRSLALDTGSAALVVPFEAPRTTIAAFVAEFKPLLS